MVDTTVASERRDFYVYVIFRPNGVPCYVGKGRGRRWLVHKTRGQNKHLSAIYAKAGGDLPILKVRENLTGLEAVDTEIALIAAIGRETCGGPLVNLTDGGDGTVGFSEPKSAEHRRKIGDAQKGKIISVECRALLSKANRGRKRSPESIAKSIAGNLGRKRSPEACKRMALAQKAVDRSGQVFSAETRAKMSAARKGRKQSEEHIARRAAAARGKPKSEAAKQAMREAAARRWALPGEREKVSAFHAAMTPEQKAVRAAKIGNIVREKLAAPEIRAKLSAAARARPDMHLNFTRKHVQHHSKRDGNGEPA